MSHEVLVVVGTGGMGAAIARRLGPGRRILLADLRQDTVDTLADTMRGEGHDVHSTIVDVSSPDSVTALAATAANLGSVRHLAHTAGLSPVQAPVPAILKVDLVGVALVLDAFTDVIADHGSGVVISSMAGHSPYPIDAETERVLATMPGVELASWEGLQADHFADSGAAYVYAKRANLIRVRATAADWGSRGARINSISPGVISTPMGQGEIEGPVGEMLRQTVANVGVRRFGNADDIAAAADFLLGPHASYVTGTDLLVDGGFTAAGTGR